MPARLPDWLDQLLLSIHTDRSQAQTLHRSGAILLFLGVRFACKFVREFPLHRWRDGHAFHRRETLPYHTLKALETKAQGK